MKRMTLMIAGLLVASLAAFGAGLDGKWTAEIVARTAKGGESKVATTFDFKTSGETLRGTVSAAARRTTTAEITEGKIAGSKFSFKTKQTNKKGEQINVWEGTLDGDSFAGSRMREGAKKGTHFTAKRAK